MLVLHVGDERLDALEAQEQAGGDYLLKSGDR